MDNKIYDYIQRLLISLDIPYEPMTISQVFDFERSREDILQHVILSGKEDFNSHNWNHLKESISKECLQIPVGLNTIGMLVDRLSILAIKKVKNKASINKELNQQIVEMIESINFCQSGKSSMFNKVTTIEVKSALDHPVDIILHLTFVNLLIWLAQDVLYLRGAGALPKDELRDYINYFSEKNVLRNHLISLLASHW
ncbi:hypothetical protein [Polynucleobacter sp. CS-Odin-A6]|uniref:hypothetical protein n=1 Tax=Polynucleobacter sp. CS-Odin-A6 TaxID=2689106 RepID=UPI001C0E8635|nr:hypothetical protein [Polynucleobacter sp. CS-Odin-A6]MBU3621839.1 hypothetical protein [Polynucleobacter sp. CS-Odin-A6]